MKIIDFIRNKIIDKIKKYAKQKGKKFLDDDFCKLKGLSHSKFYRKLKSVESFIDFECIEKMYLVLSRDILEVRHSYLKDYFKHVLLPERKDKILEHYQNRIDCLSFITTSSPILFISMYSSQLSENIEDILNASTQQNSIIKELNICVNEEGSDYENRDVIFNKIRRWRGDTENQIGDVYIRLIFRNYNVPATVAGVVDGKLISFVRDGEQFIKLSDVGQKLIVDDVIQMMSPEYSERLLLEHGDVIDYDDVNNVDNPAIKLTDF